MVKVYILASIKNNYLIMQTKLKYICVLQGASRIFFCVHNES